MSIGSAPAFLFDAVARKAMALHGFGCARFRADGMIVASSAGPAAWIGGLGEDAFQSPVLAGLQDQLNRLRLGKAPRLLLPGLALGMGARFDVSIIWLETENCFDVHSQLLGASAEVDAALARERRARQLAEEQARHAKEQAQRSKDEAEAQMRAALITRERLRIAHDLHDTIVHALVAVVAQLGLVKKLFARDPARAGEELNRALSAAREGLGGAREALGQVRFERAGVDGLGAALERAARRFEERTGLIVEASIAGGVNALAGERAEIIYRIVEEALRNVASHARARQVSIAADLEADEARIEIQDDGEGFDLRAENPGHYGLIGMAEQAHMIGGRLTIETQRGAGVRLVLRAPVVDRAHLALHDA